MAVAGKRLCEGSWQGHQGSNPRPTVLETVALPTELYPCNAGLTKAPPADSQEGNHQKGVAFFAT